ncbi:hypothetical protein DH2020_038538 [Rehmannia glutinosa]|uniref:Uncharacterized protein n=1 Tax=Rehmannia glutinosa TaxID=99300 RepID=A0ABR0UZN6_REHGL
MKTLKLTRAGVADISITNSYKWRHRRSNQRQRGLQSAAPAPRIPAAAPSAVRVASADSPGKFVNTTRGSTTPFPEISLDDLALEFFSSSSKNENESDGVVVERKGREGRSASRHGEIGRWASDTASSRRRGRSVSKTRGNVVSCSSASGAKMSFHLMRVPGDGGHCRWRGIRLATLRTENSEVDHSRNLSNRATVKAPFNGNSQMPLAQKTIASSNRRLGRSRSHKDVSLLHDGYSAEHPTEDVANGGLYEAMRKELRYAVQEIRSELNQVRQNKISLLKLFRVTLLDGLNGCWFYLLNYLFCAQAMGRNQALASGDCLRSENSEALQDLSIIREKYATKLEQVFCFFICESYFQVPIRLVFSLLPHKLRARQKLGPGTINSKPVV